MKNFKILLIAILSFCSSLYAQKTYKKFAILIASYNNESYVKSNILSALQDYPEEYYRIIYIDDCSTDKTHEKAKKIISRINKPHLITLVRNETRMGALYNHWNTINNTLADDEIVVILDGDDQLAGSFVLSYLNEIYSKEDIWLTYGQYQEINSKALGFNKPMPEHIVKNNSFRKYQDIPSHLRTFYAKLYKNIKVEDLTMNGCFFEMCADIAT